MPDVHVVLGANGGAGAAVVRALSDQQVPVRAVMRRAPTRALPPGVELALADARDAGALDQACRGAAAVYHCINVPYADWQAMLPGILENAIRASANAEAVLMYSDNLYMYGKPGGPMTEQHPRAASGHKGKLRAQLEDRVLKAHAAGDVRAAIGRASDFFGPGAENTIAGRLVFPAVRHGKRAHWVGSLDAPHTMNYIDDVARALIVLATDERAWGEVWHLPADDPVTGREFIRMAFEVAGREPRIGMYPRWMMRLAGLFDRQLRELVEVLYQFEEPFVLDSSRFMSTFEGFIVTPTREAIARTIASDGES